MVTKRPSFTEDLPGYLSLHPRFTDTTHSSFQYISRVRAQFSVTFYHGTTPGRCWLRPRHTGWRQAVLTQEHVARCSPHSLVGAQKTAVTCLSIFSSSLPFSLNLSSVKHPNCARGKYQNPLSMCRIWNSAPPSALFFNTLFTHAFFLIAKNDFLFGDSFPLLGA